ncbi:zinc ribbon domain-containing protein [Acidovorax sp. SUPP1855]|uniref:zinc ribbon domain-containing protein n=1 Tax=Acidovorax sp. SUPP1855 TaxID=431774 RepID=UPI0023DE41B6|nr:zinc ribbon domain-containing protein [Acidovorax sp. SUPP1855]GKS86135.1 zinc ribbon domain-containing protein [Acidovorax sp. SUPP1855]
MSKSLRLSEKWFRRGLWLVSLVFASFLIGLGGTVVDDLPKVEATLQLDDFLDRPAAETLRAQVRNAQQAEESAETALDQARLQRAKSRSETAAERETFNNWLATRSATQQSEHNPEVVQRTQALDRLQLRERQTQQAVEAQQQAALDARQAATAAQQRLAALEKEGYERMAVQQRKVQLRVFLYRLALTLPLLVIAGWLFVKKRKGTYWPFVWGFIFFALFAFFVELVPYLPSYGGYVRYVVGIIVTALVGRYAIVALNRYLERQKRAEALPDQERRKELSYDVALARLAKGVCPGCERPVDLKDPTIDFCPHCGIGLFDHCGACNTRKSAFARFCHACGAGAGRGLLPGSESDASAAVVPHAAGPLAGGPAPAGPL